MAAARRRTSASSCPTQSTAAAEKAGGVARPISAARPLPGLGEDHKTHGSNLPDSARRARSGPSHTKRVGAVTLATMAGYEWISLTTDYGTFDGFVAACHGTIARLAPAVLVID